MNPALHARLIAIKRRLSLRFKGGFNPYPMPPAGIDLNPSAAHFRAYDDAALALSWQNNEHEDVVAWQEKARSKLAALLGYSREDSPVEIRQQQDLEAARNLDRQHYYLQRPGGPTIPVSVLRAREADRPAPVMICLQGTNSGAHLSWGEARMPADPLKIAAGADYARQSVSQGYTAVCIEQSAFGERRETNLPQASKDPCIDAANHALLLGRTLLGERVSDVSAVIDWLESGPCQISVDTSRISIMGSSSGGSTAFYSAALDHRIGSVLTSGCVGYIRETIARRGNASGQNIIPGILNWLEIDDIIGLIAPRPFLVVSGTSDHIWPYEGAVQVIQSAQRIYTARGAENAIIAVPAAGGHRFYPEIAWRYFEDLVAQHSIVDRLT